MDLTFIKSVKELKTMPEDTIVRGWVGEEGEIDSSGELTDYQAATCIDFVVRNNGAFKVYVNTENALDRNSPRNEFVDYCNLGVRLMDLKQAPSGWLK
ncbi:hypothetical protein [Paenibacillus sp. Leaf72]|uniref:hypothetical protein n=1 Tax=Paenibacillus sp. Leaf72 TaxID=1736234 RepID=UPI0006FA1223|nr:hypothetical protein [Paenibacillus sp. Leaf72]KQN96897.1 hypothetical protein ASF12_22780 [Paenibacillus sp. Leaf72]